MWTHDRPFKPLLPSLDRISYHAETEFYQSLNKNRLIAFIGSGVALPYGRLSWSELCALLIMDVDKEFWKTLKDYHKKGIGCSSFSDSLMKEAKFLHCTLRVILGEDKLPEKEVFPFYDSIKFLDDSDLPVDQSLLLMPTVDIEISPDTTILELCSELATLLGKQRKPEKSECSNFLKNRAAKYLTEDSLGQFGSRLKLLNGYGKDSVYEYWVQTLKEYGKEQDKEQDFDKKFDQLIKSKIISKKWLTNDKTSFKRSAIEERPWKQLLTKVKKSEDGKDNLHLGIFDELFENLIVILACASMPNARIEQGDWSDPIKTIINELNINRLVTLNYDTEIERHFLQTKDYKAQENDHLLMQYNKQIKAEKIAERRNGFGARLTSVTLEKNLVGKLINFAAASKRNHSFIFHLHGRGDCAEGLILTENDYQDLYVRSSASRRAFTEGIDTLFSGNDVLFLGVGMNESDLLRPLRQFVSESQDISLRHNGILALLSEDLDDSNTEEQALKLHTKYGVKSIFYDSNARDVSVSMKDQEYKGSKDRLHCQLEIMKSSRERTGKQSKAFDEKLKKLAGKQQKWWADWRRVPGKRVAKFIDWKTRNNNIDPEKPSMVIPRLWIRQKICLLDNNKNELSIESGNALFSVIIDKMKKRIGLVNKDDNEDLNTVLSTIIDRMVVGVPPVTEGDKQKPKYRIIHRYAGSMGTGKGALVHSLQAYCENEIKDENFHHCFFSDAKFSTEYTSVISALSRFLAGIIAEQVWEEEAIRGGTGKTLEGKYIGITKESLDSIYAKYEVKNAFRDEAEEKKTFDKKWVRNNLGIKLPCGKTRILQTYLGYFVVSIDKHNDAINKKKSIPRILICLSGLDRLVDKYGYAHNALHRDFFKVLTNPDNINIPLTLILIAGKPETPIRYLSEIYGNKKQDNNNEETPWDSQDAKLLPWDIIPKTEIDERYWLPTCSIVGSETSEPEDSRTCDITLGILPEKEQIDPIRNSLAKVAYEHVSVHFWLRLLLKELQQEKEKEKAFLDSLDLAASREGVNGVIDKLLNIYDVFDTTPLENRPLTGYQTILRHLALFSVPIERVVLVNCPEVVEAVFLDNDTFRSEKVIANKIEGFLKNLNKIGLIIKIERSGSINQIGEHEDLDAGYRYTLASIMRKHLSNRMDFDAYTHGEFSFFDVSLYPTQPLDLPSPKERDFLFIGKILQKIITNARHNLDYLKSLRYERKNQDTITLSEVKALYTKYLEKTGQDSIHSLSQTIRAAVNLVNGSFSIGVVSRLDSTELKNIEYVCGHAQPFEAYNRWLRCLSNIAVAIEQETIKQENTDKQFSIQRPLYETEAAWIFNEQGLVNLIQGRVFDALELFRMAKERLNSSPWVDPDTVKSYPSLTSLRRVELNYAITLLDSGNIKEAEQEFTRLYIRKKHNTRNKTSLTVHLACGYLGFCYHLQGRVTQAEERYKEALDFFKEENKNYLRVTAIFRQYYGNLKRVLNDYENAELFLNIAISAAASAKQMDVFHHSSVSKAKILLEKADKGYAPEAIALLNNAATYAENMGLFKLKVHADIIRGEILIKQEQYTIAGKLLANAIAISNKHGLRIMKIRALQVYGQALIQRGTDKQVTDDILSTAKRLSESTGYLIKWVKDN